MGIQFIHICLHKAWQRLSTLKGYLWALLFIVGWWGVVFHRPTPHSDSTPATLFVSRAAVLPSYLAPIDRDRLRQALGGDVEIMVRLMADWDVEAQLLEAEGISPVERLPQEDFQQAQRIGRLMLQAHPEQISSLDRELQPFFITDDAGRVIDLRSSYHRFLPQTQAAASILLALLDPKEIVALPSGLRKLKQLYSEKTTQPIALDMDPYNAEAIHLMRPEVAFVAHYSLPATVEALKHRNVRLFELNEIKTIEAIRKSIVRVGHVVGRPLKATLLSTFMEAALKAIDNRLVRSRQLSKGSTPSRVLYLSYYTSFHTPTPQSLTGQLLQRLTLKPLVSPKNNDSTEWDIPLDKESLAALAPDAIIISSPHGPGVRTLLLSTPAFQQLPAVQQGCIRLVDDEIQQCPSQYLALAYCDLATAIMEIYPQ